MTKKHFIEVAKMINETKDTKLALWFADFFAKYNKLFSRERFLSACGVENNYLFESPEKTIKRIQEEF